MVFFSVCFFFRFTGIQYDSMGMYVNNSFMFFSLISQSEIHYLGNQLRDYFFQGGKWMFAMKLTAHDHNMIDFVSESGDNNQLCKLVNHRDPAPSIYCMQVAYVKIWYGHDVKCLIRRVCRQRSTSGSGSLLHRLYPLTSMHGLTNHQTRTDWSPTPPKGAQDGVMNMRGIYRNRNWKWWKS